MTTSPMPAGAGPATPEVQTCKGPGYHPEAPANRHTTDSAHSTEAGHAAQLVEALRRKTEATLIARAALVGIQLVRLADGTWLASKFGLTKHLEDSDVSAWLARVGAPA